MFLKYNKKQYSYTSSSNIKYHININKNSELKINPLSFADSIGA